MQLLPFEVVKTTSRLRVEKFSNLLQLYGGDLPSVKSFDVGGKTSGLATSSKLKD